MALQPAGWYTDPTHTYSYRYWNGTAWSNQVSSGGTSGTDPNPMDSDAAATPPAPGTEAPRSPQPEAAPAVQVTQSSSGSAFGVIFGILIAVIAVVVLILVLVNASSDDTSVPTTGASVTTVAPATTTP